MDSLQTSTKKLSSKFKTSKLGRSPTSNTSGIRLLRKFNIFICRKVENANVSMSSISLWEKLATKSFDSVRKSSCFNDVNLFQLMSNVCKLLLRENQLFFKVDVWVLEMFNWINWVKPRKPYSGSCSVPACDRSKLSIYSRLRLFSRIFNYLFWFLQLNWY